MIQTALLFLAPDLKVPVTPPTESPRCKPMATRPVFELIDRWRRGAETGLAVLGNALGLLLFLAGLGLVLRLAELLLA